MAWAYILHGDSGRHNPVDFYNLSFAKRGLDSWHQNRHLCQILGRARLDSDAGTDNRALWRKHVVR
jgi:hypothetical protein